MTSRAFSLLTVAASVIVAPAATAQDFDKSACTAASIVFLIDNSYSFGNAHAQREAFTAGIEAYLAQLGDQHHVGLVRFGTTAKVVVPLTPRAKAAKKVVAQIGRLRFKEQWTDVYGGVREAWMTASADKERRGIVVVVSDGAISMPDPEDPGSKRESGRAKALQLEWVRGTLPRIQQSNTEFHTIAYVGDNTDYALMEEIAKATGGTYQVGESDNIAAVMGELSAETCRKTGGAKKAPAAKAEPPVAEAPVEAAPVEPSPPVEPVPVPTPSAPSGTGPASAGAATGLWLGLIGGGVVLLGLGVFIAARRRRKRRRPSAPRNLPRTGGRAERPKIDVKRRHRPARAQVQEQAAAHFSTRSSTLEIDRESLPKVGPGPAPVAGSGDKTLLPGDLAPPKSKLHFPDVTRMPGAMAAHAVAQSRAASPQPAPPKPPTPPKRTEQHMVRLIGYTAGGVLIKQVDFRRSGDVITAVGSAAGAVLDVPRGQRNVCGSLQLTIERDGTYVVRVKDVPPGGFRDRDTGHSLGHGARLTNNVRFEWAKEERGRYFEVIFK